jgi:hypothetical protein
MMTGKTGTLTTNKGVTQIAKGIDSKREKAGAPRTEESLIVTKARYMSKVGETKLLVGGNMSGEFEMNSMKIISDMTERGLRQMRQSNSYFASVCLCYNLPSTRDLNLSMSKPLNHLPSSEQIEACFYIHYFFRFTLSHHGLYKTS